MPHTNRKKKYPTSIDVDGKLSKQAPSKKFTHAKRELVESSDGWTQVASSGWKTAKPHIHNHLQSDGPNGPSPQVLDMSLDEMRAGYERCRKAWEESEACVQLKAILTDQKTGSAGRCGIDNVVCLGLGSMHTVSLVWRRASCTQLAALETIREVLCLKSRAVVQDPHFSDLDNEFLKSLGYEVVKDPEAFTHVDSRSLVYAIHCDRPVYLKIREGRWPALLIGNSLQHKLELENYTQSVQPDNVAGESLLEGSPSKRQDLLSMVENSNEIAFPHLDNYFSDTIIYWRQLQAPENSPELDTTG